MVVSVMSASSRTEITQKSWDKFSTTLHIVQSFNQNPERIVSSQTQNTTSDYKEEDYCRNGVLPVFKI